MVNYEPINIIVGSNNPVKVEAVRRGFARSFPDHSFTVEGLEVPSGVPIQPFSDAETYQGALNRAQRAQQSAPQADFWVGIEGGVMEDDATMWGVAWIVILSAEKIGKSRTATFIVPQEMAALIRAGHEMGEATDQVFAKTNSKQAEGIVGALTGNTLTRTEYYEHAVLIALMPFKTPHLRF